ncbi:AAA family ATPase [Pseudoalteromonas sp. SG44-5]|uniref:TrlF family AAA-like ATPase n=1 Tax=unclassified Pseudoalteromonas TaxID=194690 RepID=UPI0015FB7249|nr:MULTISPECIES: PHP-associated domain-containing protein [unclassified Pseudoalteromonas]MBB1404346.1 AAA family ATPase [Pseudoalteromonas sp. SG44-5]MBH0092700.1 AAA family ATPase [Pseudoalteromonas sp. SCQQ13]
MNFVGARWWKFDFHTHTPASFDYGKSDSALKTSKSPRDWLLDYIAKGIECVAITDHNTGDWVDGLKDAAESLRAENHSIYVFPGVEITASSNIHVLAIFDPSATSADINAVVGASKFRGTKGDSDSVAEESAENIIKEIQSAGGVAIPAHIDMKAGLCQQPSSHTVKQVCTHANAVEIVFPDREVAATPLSRYTNLNIELPSVIGSDAHHPNDIGRAFTWVKMSSPSIDGLKLALVDGSSSLIRSDSEISDPNRASNTLLRSVTIESAKYAGRSSPLVIEFNPWLNSIIGGRGSGKSSVLEFIRLGMDRSRDLEDLNPQNEIRRSFESFIKVAVSRDADGVMLPNTKISCVYTRDDVHYLLKWTKESNRVSIFRSEGGEWLPEDGEAHSRFPIKIFSQKQIFNLAKNPNTLLRLIDESSTVGFQQWKMEWEDKYTHFQTLCSQRRELQSRLSNKNVLLGQLSDVEQKIKTIEQSGHADILNSYQDFRAKRTRVAQYETDVVNLKTQVETIINTVEIPTADASIFNNLVGSEQEVATKISNLIQAASNFKENIANAITAIDSELANFKEWYCRSEFNQAHIAADEKYNKLIESLQSQGVTSPADYSKLIGDRETINKSLKSMELIDNQVVELTTSINESYQEIIECRKRLTVNRLAFLEQYLSGNSSIQVEITPFSDSEDLDASFRKILGRTDSAFSAEIFDLDRECGFLFNLNKELSTITKATDPNNLEQWLNQIHSFKQGIFNFNSGEILSTKLGKRFIDFMSQLQPQNFDAMNTWFPEDKLTIKFNDGNRFKDVSQGSAGQKASAILSFLLSYGTEPLLLDQPEDDLDNGLITSLIVSKLHENKADRQIIVVTHNPNIVVNGDSEYVVALEDRGQINSLASGALQEVDVRKNVCEIMEGGELALQKRYKRMFNI